jgi:ribonuclease T2
MRRTVFRTVAVLAAASILTATAVQARKRKPRASTRSFAYFMLVLSYAPDFCDQRSVDKDPRECGVGEKVGFVVHGLWPQGETTKGPENCGGPTKIPQSTITAMLKYFPTEKLIQHEWTTHGTCSGLDMDAYFAAVKKARDAVEIPDSLTPTRETSMKPADVDAEMASANPTYPKTAFRSSCYPDKELQEVRVCLAKDLTPRACGTSAGKCSIANVTLLPLR